jgi:hypothetical protein
VRRLLLASQILLALRARTNPAGELAHIPIETSGHTG